MSQRVGAIDLRAVEEGREELFQSFNIHHSLLSTVPDPEPATYNINMQRRHSQPYLFFESAKQWCLENGGGGQVGK